MTLGKSSQVKSKYPKIGLADANAHQEYFKYGEHKYSCARLFDIAKKLPVFDLPIAGINLTDTPFDGCDMIDLAWHCKKVNDGDMKWPIILMKDGAIADGRHRIIKALMEGRETIKAVRLDFWPEPCSVDADKTTKSK